MKSIIIAAGYGSRLEKETQTKPKGLLDINGKTILNRQISLFRKNGINEIIIITGPYKEFGIENISYIHDENYNQHDVLGSLMAAKDEIQGNVLTSYSDILFDESILKQLLGFSGDIGIPVDLDWEKSYDGRTEHPKSEADNVLIKNGKIIKIQKKIDKENLKDVIGEFLGPIIFSEKGSRDFVENFLRLKKTHQGPFHRAPSLKKAYLTDMLQDLIDLGYEITPIIVNGKWCEIDTLQDLEKAKKLFL
jgi:L-glutamine-phosphate cytidylyltransferase